MNQFTNSRAVVLTNVSFNTLKVVGNSIEGLELQLKLLKWSRCYCRARDGVFICQGQSIFRMASFGQQGGSPGVALCSHQWSVFPKLP